MGLRRPRCRSGGARSHPAGLQRAAGWPLFRCGDISGRSQPEHALKRLLQHHELPEQAAVIGPASEMRSEEHTSELQSLMRISYAVICLKKKKHHTPKKKYSTIAIKTLSK